jgi:pentapeptide MXKDX repeat protein
VRFAGPKFVGNGGRVGAGAIGRERLSLADGKFCEYGEFCQVFANLKENNMKKLMTICFALCFALALLTFGVASAQDNMKNDNMKTDSSKPIQVTGKVSDDGKMFVNDKDSKSWTISNPDAVKGHEGHHVTLTAHVYEDKNEVHVLSLKMAK